MGLGLSSGVMKKLWHQTEVVVLQHYECTKCHWLVRFQVVNYILCKFHLNKFFLKKEWMDICLCRMLPLWPITANKFQFFVFFFKSLKYRERVYDWPNLGHTHTPWAPCMTILLGYIQLGQESFPYGNIRVLFTKGKADTELQNKGKKKVGLQQLLVTMIYFLLISQELCQAPEIMSK